MVHDLLLKELQPTIKKLQKQIERLRYALLLSGLCPDCGQILKVEKTQLSYGPAQRYKCGCGLDMILSEKKILRIRKKRIEDMKEPQEPSH